MKKVFQLCIICSVLLVTACKKEASTITELATIAHIEPQTETESTGSATNGEWAEPNAAVKLTDELNAALEAGEPIFVKEVEDKHYIGEAVATAQTATTYVSCNGVMNRFAIYLNANKPASQAWANANCKPYVANYTDPCGKKVLFMITPNDPKCGSAFTPNNTCWQAFITGGWMYMPYHYCIFD